MHWMRFLHNAYNFECSTIGYWGYTQMTNVATLEGLQIVVYMDFAGTPQWYDVGTSI